MQTYFLSNKISNVSYFQTKYQSVWIFSIELSFISENRLKKYIKHTCIWAAIRNYLIVTISFIFI